MQRVRVVVAAAAALAVFLTGSVAMARPAHATVASDEAQIAQLGKQIAAQGARVKSLVGRANSVQAHIRELDALIAADSARLGNDHRQEDAAMATLQRAAIRVYVTGAGLNLPALGLFGDTATVTSMLEQNRYLGAVSDAVNQALNVAHAAQQRTRDDVDELQSEQKRANASADELTADRRTAQVAIAADEATLNRVKGDLHALLVAAGERVAQQLAAERALAALPWSAKHGKPPTIPRATPGVYVNPLRAIRGLIPERIDQGVDFAGFGPVYAIGNGVVLATAIPGWPGGTFIAYQLTGGPANGLVVYAAEDILPAVQIGDIVTANTVLGLMYPGPDGIETGWADGSRIGNTMARTYRQFDGSNSTAFGVNFSELLQYLGAPGGIPQNFAASGSLPPGWPHWPPNGLAPSSPPAG